MHLTLCYKLMQLICILSLKIKDHSLFLEVQLLVRTSMGSFGLVIIMLIGNFLDHLLLIISIFNFMEYKWLGLIFVASQVIPTNNFAQDGIN